jgi:hypothetical protein
MRQTRKKILTEASTHLSSKLLERGRVPPVLSWWIAWPSQHGRQHSRRKQRNNLQLKWEKFPVCKIKSNQIKSNQIKSNQIYSNQIKSNQIKTNAFL